MDLRRQVGSAGPMAGSRVLGLPRWPCMAEAHETSLLELEAQVPSEVVHVAQWKLQLWEKEAHSTRVRISFYRSRCGVCTQVVQRIRTGTHTGTRHGGKQLPAGRACLRWGE